MKKLLLTGFYARNRIYFALCCGAISALSMTVASAGHFSLTSMFAFDFLFYFVMSFGILWSAAYLIDEHRGRIDEDKRSNNDDG